MTIHYLSAAPMPSLPEDKIPTSRQASVTQANPDYDAFNPILSQEHGQQPFITKTTDVPTTDEEKLNFETARTALVDRYNSEAQQEQTLFSNLQNRRRASGAPGGGTILTGPLAPASGTALGSGSGKTLLGQ